MRTEPVRCVNPTIEMREPLFEGEDKLSPYRMPAIMRDVVFERGPKCRG